jgi:N-ethylmaleimide reductase
VTTPVDPPPLFTPIRVGAVESPNRIVMAPMTRRRAGPDGAPTSLNALYYAQRAAAGLIVGEATVIGPDAGGIPGSPGIYAPAHVLGWRRVADAVHDAGGRIFLQLWHAGRVSHPDWIGGVVPCAPSEVALEGSLPGRPDARYPRPRELDGTGLSDIVSTFARATRYAREAGCDGVEIHAAQGYLLDQFLRDSTNRRKDEYGGPPENRARLLLEVVDAVATAWSPERVGVQVSPTSTLHGMSDADPEGLFGVVAERLSPFGLAYLHVHEPIGGTVENRVAPSLQKRFRGPLILNGSYDAGTAAAAVAAGRADLISFGRPFIANPDLPARFRTGAALSLPDRGTFYGGGAEGYTDYPTADGRIVGLGPAAGPRD